MVKGHMKCLTIFGLLTLVLNAHAKDSVTSDETKLLGSWQCQNHLLSPSMTSTVTATMNFLPENVLYVQKTSHIVLNKDAATSMTGTYHISTTRHWSVGHNKDERWLADQVTRINAFSVDNPELEKELSLKQYLDGKPNSTTVIKTLTNDTLVFELNDGVTLLNCKKQPSPQVL